jgi:HPt (histidine-containing phosphotransfer) domain-containing protein
MTSPERMTSPELLRFFHAEAREYLDAVEDLLSGDASFEAGAFVAASRALRGSATMARVPRVAEIALYMERIANAVRDGEIDWSSDLRRDLGGTIADLRHFVAASGNWSTDDDRRAVDRLASLRALLPAGKTTPPSPSSAGTTPIFIALQSSAIATDLENFLSNPDDRALVTDVVNRLRSLRGIAGVADYPPLGEVTDAVERTLRELVPDGVLREADTELLTAAGAVFRRASSELRARGRFESSAADVDRFARAAASFGAPPLAREAPIVRVEELFYTDAGPHLVKRGAAPSRSAEARFREEVITRAEHLRRLVAEARVAMDPFTLERVRRDLKAHLGRLDEFARSFGAQQVASVVGEAAAMDSFTDSTLDAIESVARILTTSGIGLDEMESHLAIGERKRWTPVSTPVTPASVPSRQADRSASPSPRSGRALRDMLDASLTQLSSLEEIPLVEPVKTDDDAVVSVEVLLYRGQAALERARALRDELRSRGTTDPEALHELYELLDLARVE